MRDFEQFSHCFTPFSRVHIRNSTPLGGWCSILLNKAETSLIELEYHAPFKTLKPGESMKANEVWEILHYSGKHNEDDLCNFFLNSI